MKEAVNGRGLTPQLQAANATACSDAAPTFEHVESARSMDPSCSLKNSGQWPQFKQGGERFGEVLLFHAPL
jgi:hypothetical protein